MRIDWLKLLWILGLGLVVPGISLYAVYWWFITFVLPVLGVPLTEVAAKPVLEIIIAVCFFFGSPTLLIISISCFLMAVRIILD